MYNVSLSKQYIQNPENKKNILVFLYLYHHEQRNGDIIFSVNDIIDFWNYQRTNKQGEIPDKLKECLMNLQKEDFFETNSNLQNIANAEKILVRFKKDKNNNYNWLNKNQTFVFLSDEEILKFQQYRKTNKTHIDKLISLYLVLKSFMNFSEEIPYCYYYLEKIIKINNLSKNTFLKMIDILKKLGLIYNYKFYYTSTKCSVKYCEVYTTVECGDTYKLQLLKNNLCSKLYDFDDWYTTN